MVMSLNISRMFSAVAAVEHLHARRHPGGRDLLLDRRRSPARAGPPRTGSRPPSPAVRGPSAESPTAPCRRDRWRPGSAAPADRSGSPERYAPTSCALERSDLVEHHAEIELGVPVLVLGGDVSLDGRARRRVLPRPASIPSRAHFSRSTSILHFGFPLFPRRRDIGRPSCPPHDACYGFRERGRPLPDRDPMISTWTGDALAEPHMLMVLKLVFRPGISAGLLLDGHHHGLR